MLFIIIQDHENQIVDLYGPLTDQEECEAYLLSWGFNRVSDILWIGSDLWARIRTAKEPTRGTIQ